MATELKRRRFSVTDFHQMADSGILAPDERVELIDGELVEMSPIGAQHFGRHGRIVQYLHRVLAMRALIFGQISLPLGTANEPQPDIVVAAPNPMSYEDRHPRIDEIFAVIELAASSLAIDTGIKLRLYGRFRIQDYIVVDLNGNTALHFHEPNDVGYSGRTPLMYGNRFALGALPEIILDANEFLALQN